jgi:hypothetical protein
VCAPNHYEPIYHRWCSCHEPLRQGRPLHQRYSVPCGRQRRTASASAGLTSIRSAKGCICGREPLVSSIVHCRCKDSSAPLQVRATIRECATVRARALLMSSAARSAVTRAATRRAQHGALRTRVDTFDVCWQPAAVLMAMAVQQRMFRRQDNWYNGCARTVRCAAPIP